jgi:hypothetical protein
MKKQPLLLIVVFALALSTAFANDPDNCPPAGTGPGPTGPYDFIANGVPNTSSCWYKNNVVFWSGYDSCGVFSEYWAVGGGNGSLSQRFVVPSDWTVTGLKVTYTLDFVDPTSNGNNNAVIADVNDITTGQWLGGNSYTGWTGTLHCSIRTASMNTSNLAGHTIELKFTTRKANDSSVSIGIRRISLVTN